METRGDLLHQYSEMPSKTSAAHFQGYQNCDITLLACRRRYESREHLTMEPFSAFPDNPRTFPAASVEVDWFSFDCRKAERWLGTRPPWPHLICMLAS